MNFIKNEIESIGVRSVEQAKDVLKALIQTILFNGAIGIRSGIEEKFKTLDIVYMTSGIETINFKVNEELTAALGS